MDTQAAAGTSIHPLAWVAGIAVIVFSGLGIGALMGWIPNSIGNAAGRPPLEAQAQAPVNARQASPVSPAATASQAAPVKRVAPVPRAGAATLPAPAPIVAAAVANARCAECGVIESVREVDTKGTGTGLGAIGGAVAGGLLGSQVGGGRGKDVMAVVGAVGGGFAGNEVEKRVKSTKSYSVVVRFDDGSSRAFSEPILPAWRLGDKVRVVDGEIRSGS